MSAKRGRIRTNRCADQTLLATRDYNSAYRMKPLPRVKGSANRVGVMPQPESPLRHAMLKRLLPQQPVGAMLLQEDLVVLDGLL